MYPPWVCGAGVGWELVTSTGMSMSAINCSWRQCWQQETTDQQKSQGLWNRMDTDGCNTGGKRVILILNKKTVSCSMCRK